MNLRDDLSREAVATLRVTQAARVGPEANVAEAIELMRARSTGCVVITDQDVPMGILTERDVLTKILPEGISLTAPIAKVMTRDPKVIDDRCSVATVIRRMHEGGFRHLPVVDQARRLQGVISVKRIVEYLAEFFPTAVFNLPPEPAQQQRAREGA